MKQQQDGRFGVLVAAIQLSVSAGYFALAITEPDAARGALVVALYVLTLVLSWCFRRRHRVRG